MKKWTFFIAAILCITSYTSTVLSVQNSNTDNYASQYISQPDYSVIGLANTTIPVDINGNQIITGNVRDGKSFQGNMPYNSPLSFNATLGSSTLSSFMRDSAGTEDLGRYLTNNISSTTGSNYQSYYLPSQTVTTLSQNKVGGTDYTNPVYTNGLQNRANP